MRELKLKARSECRYDLISLGEVMLRFDPGDRRIRDARQFFVWEGGGEYNVARNLAHSFGLKTSIATALADNEVGRLVENLIRQAGVDTGDIVWRPTDGISKTVRNGFYFWERGFGLRQATGCSDRGNTAVSQLQAGDIDWKASFNKGVRWFHTGGIFAGLSSSTAAVAREALSAARENGCGISYDLNYRHSLWADRGGKEAANAVNRELMQYADVVFGLPDFDATLAGFSADVFKRAADKMFDANSDLKLVCSTVRNIHNDSLHDLSGAIYDGNTVEAPTYSNVIVLDRVGSGDAFAAGIIYETLDGKDAEQAVRTGTAAAVLAMTSPGDGLAAGYSEIIELSREGKQQTAR